TDGARDRGPAVQLPYGLPSFFFGVDVLVERRAAAGHLPPGTQARRKLFQTRFDMLGGATQLVRSVTVDLVPRSIHVCRRKLDAGPRDRKPGRLHRQWGQTLAAAFSSRASPEQEETNIRTQPIRNRPP